jgi:hypothetical protein
MDAKIIPTAIVGAADKSISRDAGLATRAQGAVLIEKTPAIQTKSVDHIQ